MIITETFEPRSRQDWRKWLGRHHVEKKTIWLVFLKKHTKQATFTYQDALEEALCFGWIDGVRQRIDDLRFAQRFTPRTKSSRWSETNRALAADLEARGLMTPAGLAARGSAPPDPPPAREQPSGVPEWLVGALRTSPLAWKNFNALPPSHQRRYVGWISSAKRDETRRGRVAEAIALLMENKRIGLGPGEVRK
ncbi:MAG: YdeI/OmpD-associated family protein [Thermoanaerobaculia bacterium]